MQLKLNHLVRLFPLPWGCDVTPQEVPPERLTATVYAADSTRICETRGEHAADLAQVIVDAVNKHLKPSCLEDYDRLDFWCQGWMRKLNHVIGLRNHSYNEVERERLDLRIKHLRDRHDAALKRRQPFADMLLSLGRKS